MVFIKKVTTKSKTGVAMKYRPTVETNRNSAKGDKPLAEAPTISHILMMIGIHLCKKILYGINLPTKIGIYIIGTLLLSVVADFVNFSTSYFSDNNNFLNQVFVKWGWGWTLLILGPFVLITSYTYCCGNFTLIKNHLFRLLVAHFTWYFMTSLFIYIENKSGMCNTTKFHSKSSCLRHGFIWKGFDMSGHCFLLVYLNLVIIEEAKAYIGWEQIRDLIRNDEHRRMSTDLKSEEEVTPLSKLNNTEFLMLRESYKKFTPFVRALFCLMSLFSLLWDIMLFFTIIYHHIALEKVVSILLTVCAWFLTYRFWFCSILGPGLPGEGLFKYVTLKSQKNLPLKRKESLRNVNNSYNSTREEGPKFMGMPIYPSGVKKEPPKDICSQDSLGTPGENDLFSSGPSFGKGVRSRSRSSSRSRGFSSKSSLNLKYL